MKHRGTNECRLIAKLRIIKVNLAKPKYVCLLVFKAALESEIDPEVTTAVIRTNLGLGSR